MNAPSLSTQPLPAWLAQWRHHQAFLQNLEEEQAAAASEAAAGRAEGLRLLPAFPKPIGLVPASSGPVQPGQVRVLQPLPVSGALGLRPVVVLQPGAVAGCWLCAPFSLFTEPAHDGEWRTPLAQADPRLAVLALWDAADLDEAVLSRARLHDTLTTSALEEAATVWATWHQGSVLPGAAQAGIGPRYVELLDPRHEYEAEVAGALEPWSALRSFQIRAPEPVKTAAFSAAADSTLALAASPAGARSLAAVFGLGDQGLCLVVTPVSPMEARLSVQTAAGEPSLALSGGLILTAEGRRIGLEAAEIRVPLADLRAGFALVDAHGILVPLKG